MKSHRIIVLVALVAIASITHGQAPPATQPGMASRQRRDELIARARQRMARDRKKYSADQLKECEALYQIATTTGEAMRRLRR